MALFTVIADNQVHVDVGLDEAVTAVNVLNALAGAQLALTANSSVWNSQIDLDHVAVRELFWDWWGTDDFRHGIPPRPLRDFADYVQSTVELRPVYVKREGQYLGLTHYPSFLDYFGSAAPVGRSSEGQEVKLRPETADIDLHDRAFWWNARLSRFATVESRVSCQQPPGELLAPAALVLGLVENLTEAQAVLRGYRWDKLRELRTQAAHTGLQAFSDDIVVRPLLKEMLSVAQWGLRERGRDEERFLQPLQERLAQYRCPARDLREIFSQGGIEAFLDRFAWA